MCSYGKSTVFLAKWKGEKSIISNLGKMMLDEGQERVLE